MIFIQPGLGQRLSCSLACRLVRKKVTRTLLCYHLKSSRRNYKLLDLKLKYKMMEIRNGASSATTAFRSMNSMILRFPQFRRGFNNIITTFNQCDRDCDGAIGREDVEKCLKSLDVNMTKNEVEELFHSCDMDSSQSIQFNEFIVLLCLAYILTFDSRRMRSARSGELEAIFGAVVEAFLFLDKNGDGMLHKKDLIKALNDAFPYERSPKHVARNRFREMDLHRRGEVGFREFLFVFIDWVGVDGLDI